MKCKRLLYTNVCENIYKKHALPKKSPQKHQIPKDRRATMRYSKKIKMIKKYRRQKSPNKRKIKNNKQVNKQTINIYFKKMVVQLKNSIAYT